MDFLLMCVMILSPAVIFSSELEAEGNREHRYINAPDTYPVHELQPVSYFGNPMTTKTTSRYDPLRFPTPPPYVHPLFSGIEGHDHNFEPIPLEDDYEYDDYESTPQTTPRNYKTTTKPPTTPPTTHHETTTDIPTIARHEHGKFEKQPSTDDCPLAEGKSGGIVAADINVKLMRFVIGILFIVLI